MAEITLNLRERRLYCKGLDADTPRDLNDEDYRTFARWVTTYRDILNRPSDPDALLALGRELYDWLDGDLGWLQRLVDSHTSPLIVEFAVPLRPNAEHRAFQDVPWELLADTDGHWAQRSDLAFIPVRRLGQRGTLQAPSPYRLSTVFMAASPRGVQTTRFGQPRELHFEEEEAAILQATGNVGMDLVVEESGTLVLLKETLAFEPGVDMVHISCHGTANPSPRLILEDEVGQRQDAIARDIADALRVKSPNLLFLSACEVAVSGLTMDSLAVDMIQHGLPAVLGWAGSVSDVEATRFAQGLYQRLSLSQSLPEAVSGARLQLIETDENGALRSRTSRDWHLARLYLGPDGGGVLSTGRQGRRRHASDVHRAFLDNQNKLVPVAAPHEFVGRRRQIQTILRTFRQGERTGVYIHGVGRQGKSSLAARIALRMPDHQLVVLHGHYDELSILNAFAATGTDEQKRDFFDQCREEVKRDAARFPGILQELLEQHFVGVKTDEHGQVIQRPALLVVDDFEQALEERQGQTHRIMPALVPPILGVLLAFRRAETQSRLLFTSRYAFSLEHEGRNLASDLAALSLPPMEDYEAYKQASAKQRAQQDGNDGQGDIRADRMLRIVAAAVGNPGLQDMLFRLALEDENACDQAVAELQTFIDSGQEPGQEKLLKFLENLAINRILALLTRGERELLRAASAFELPIPLSIFAAFYRTAGLGEPAPAMHHLIGLGVWDRHEDPVQIQREAAAINPMFRPLSGALEEAERQVVVASLLRDLYTAWGGAEGAGRPESADHELTRLSLLAWDTEILQATAYNGIRWLVNRNDHTEAAALAKRAIEHIDSEHQIAPPELLRVGGEQAEFVGDVGFARACFNRCVEAFEAMDKVDPEELGAALLAQARRWVTEGRPDEALLIFNRVLDLLSEDRFRRERAVTSGDIARILSNKGQVDEALHMHQERLAINEQLGDTRERAVTLGDIARILRNKGQVDEALHMHQEEMAINEQLGDTRERAVTLGDIARILRNKGQVDEALHMHQEQLAIYEQLGDTRSRAVTLGDIARILSNKGQVDEALHMHQEQLAINEQLGDTRERAVTLGDIARILSDKGQVDEALHMHQEQLAIYEQLGDTRSRAVTLGDIARILSDKGQVDEALHMHQEQLAIYEQLGDTRSRAVTLGDIARILSDKGQVDEALHMHQEQLAIYEQLGDTRSRAVTLGDIARILSDKGQVDEALHMHQEQLAIYEQLGDTRSRAVTLGDIARILSDKGQVDEALHMHQEQLAIYEQLGDTRSRAVTLGDIARILSDKGQVDEALHMHQERLAIYEQLGDTRSRAVTLGDIARILRNKGQVDEALHMHQERLAINEQLGHQDGKANALWSIANIEIQLESYQAAYEHLAESYQINLNLGRLDGICFVGVDLGRLLCRAGHAEEGLKMLNRSCEGFKQLGRTQLAEHVQQLITQYTPSPPKDG